MFWRTNQRPQTYLQADTYRLATNHSAILYRHHRPFASAKTTSYLMNKSWFSQNWSPSINLRHLQTRSKHEPFLYFSLNSSYYVVEWLPTIETLTPGAGVSQLRSRTHPTHDNNAWGASFAAMCKALERVSLPQKSAWETFLHAEESDHANQGFGKAEEQPVISGPAPKETFQRDWAARNHGWWSQKASQKRAGIYPRYPLFAFSTSAYKGKSVSWLKVP